MKKEDAIKAELEHMENRTQWHSQDVERVESLRNEVTAMENDGNVSEDDKEKNKVVHQH